MNAKKLNIVLGIIIAVLVVMVIHGVVTGNIVLKNNKQAVTGRQSQEQITAEQKPANWSKYNHAKFGYSIEYPSDITVHKELDDEFGNRVVYFNKGDKPAFHIQLEKNDQSEIGVKYGLLGSVVVTSDVKVANLPAYKAVSYSGYGDAGVQGVPFVDYGVKKKGDVYHIVFDGDDNMSEQELKILSTFQFTK